MGAPRGAFTPAPAPPRLSLSFCRLASGFHTSLCASARAVAGASAGRTSSARPSSAAAAQTRPRALGPRRSPPRARHRAPRLSAVPRRGNQPGNKALRSCPAPPLRPAADAASRPVSALSPLGCAFPEPGGKRRTGGRVVSGNRGDAERTGTAASRDPGIYIPKEIFRSREGPQSDRSHAPPILILPRLGTRKF